MSWRSFVQASCVVIALGLLPRSASAQMDCNQCSADSSCDTQCWYCTMPAIDYCDQWAVEYSTCGERMGNCYRSGCNPNYREVSRELRGTFGRGYVVWCSHHRVEWVTETDVNRCHTDPARWSRSYCDTSTDGGKSTLITIDEEGNISFGGIPDCCDGRGPDGLPNPDFTCNHWHHCS